ncbi:uncharacterized protein LOC116248582 isoform X1 [Nymphaea colorata]|nr:uncharacterized protein LOC116248582 isoform X1 [Nymphaea colorata]
MRDRWGSRETPAMSSMTAKQRYRKPPRVGSLGYWKPTVPSWEKEFCARVCFIPWSKVLETKKVMSLFANVVQWDDSAGEEAFTNAKKRFWAKINDLPCDVSLPDPDIFIDRIDWDSVAAGTDPELLNSMEEEIGEGDRPEVLSIIWENQDISAIPCSGWGDDNDDNQVRAAAMQSKDGIFDSNSWDGREIPPDEDKGNAPIPRSGWGDDWAVNNHGAACGWGEEFDDWAPEKYHQENQSLTEFRDNDQSLRAKRNWANGNGNGRRRERGQGVRALLA